MKNQNFHLLLLIVGMFFSCSSPASDPSTKDKETTVTKDESNTNTHPIKRFESEIQKFEAEDKEKGYTSNGILLTGSSSIRMWKTLTEDMAPLPVLNRGFGGSTIPEVIHFAGRFLFQHQPQIVVLYCGENDIAEGASPKAVFETFKAFVKILETRLPKTKLVFISMKPSVSRWAMWDQFQEGNQLIQNFMIRRPNMWFMDSSESMLLPSGEVRTDIFIEDGLHMNAKGYKGWTEQLKPGLQEIYSKE